MEDEHNFLNECKEKKAKWVNAATKLVPQLH